MPFIIQRQLVIQTEYATKDDLLGFMFEGGICIILALDPNHTPTRDDQDYHMVITKAPLHLGWRVEELTTDDQALIRHPVIRIRRTDLIVGEPLKGRRLSHDGKTDEEIFTFAGGAPLTGVFSADPPKENPAT